MTISTNSHIRNCDNQGIDFNQYYMSKLIISNWNNFY
jgi:hypothetical protein